MNSMNNVEQSLRDKFEILNVEYPDKLQLSVDMNKENIHSALAYLKSVGFTQLSLLTCIDWIEENTFELVYILMNWDTGVHIQVRTKLDRDNPKFYTITKVFPGAQYYERDVHEFFGVEFEGNDMSFKHLFLEMWDDMPPMRKDFDPRAYKSRKSPEREYEMKFKPRVGGE